MPRSMRMVAIVFCLLTACTVKPPARFEFAVARDLQSNLSPAETELFLQRMEGWMAGDAAIRGLHGIVITSIRADGPMALVDGCGTLGGWTFPVHRQILASAVKEENGGWRMHHWEVARESLHSEPKPCDVPPAREPVVAIDRAAIFGFAPNDGDPVAADDFDHSWSGIASWAGSAELHAQIVEPRFTVVTPLGQRVQIREQTFGYLLVEPGGQRKLLLGVHTDADLRAEACRFFSALRGAAACVDS